jgi:pyruvate/oxaloacetate carboxyltransferase
VTFSQPAIQEQRQQRDETLVVMYRGCSQMGIRQSFEIVESYKKKAISFGVKTFRNL